ncbi:MAG: integrating conjugative element protein [Legionella sp.]|nr:integrating conjugative element protein [Legionella sp.]
MKKFSILLGITTMITSCYALQIINVKEYINKAQSQLTEESLKLQEKLDARLPVSSQATVGKVESQKISLTSFTQSVFIIGDDAVSRLWLKDNTARLEAANAMGFVANITESQHLQTLQQLTKAPLLPANVDDLMSIFKESHYPLAFIKGKLWQ